MPTELVIAVISGLVAIVGSFFIAIYQSRVEFRKLARQVEEKYASSLFDKRLTVYPPLYSTLSRLTSAIETNTQTTEQVKQFQDQFENWLSSNAIFVTPTTATMVWGYRAYLLNLMETFEDEPIPEERWVEIRNLNVVIGKFLRAELGVFSTQPAGTPELESPHVSEMIERLSQESGKRRSRFGY